MTREEITRMAREAGFVGFDGDNGPLRRFAALVASAEREACATVCEDMEYTPWETHHGDEDLDWWSAGVEDCASAIRARGHQ